MNRKKRLLVHQGALGDFIVTFPALSLLREAGSEIGVLAAGSHGRLACRFGLADTVHPLESARLFSLYSGEPDPHLVKNLRSYETILLVSFSRDLEVGFRRATGATVHRLSPRPEPHVRVHVADHLMAELKGFKLLSPGQTFDPGTFPPPDRKQGALPLGDPLRILIHPGAGSPRKMWPLQRFIGIARRCRSMGFLPEFLLGPAEIGLARELASGPDKGASHGWPVHRPAGLNDLVDLLRTGGGFIGNDSGVSHLAAFCGRPTVVLFGPSDPIRWRPVGPAVAVVRSPCVCPPCFETDPDNCAGGECLSRISEETVIQALAGLIRPGSVNGPRIRDLAGGESLRPHPGPVFRI